MIQINGQDGGGQVLRSALSLSLITGTPFHMVNIRGQRKNPGLKRQHLTCVKAALTVCQGAADGAELHSEELLFYPGTPVAKDYAIDIGSAGSTTLVAQTLIPVLVNLDAPSSLTITGGTHNPMAPSFHFLEKHYLPSLRAAGYQITGSLEKAGFAPAGGGTIKIQISPREPLVPIRCIETTDLQKQSATIYHYGMEKAAEDIQRILQKKEKTLEVEAVACAEAACRGLTVSLHDHHDGYTLTTEAVHELGNNNITQKLQKAHHTKRAINAPVGNRHADQLMLFLALVPQSQLITGPLTNHIKTNLNVINSFLPASLCLEELEGGKISLLNKT